MLRYVTKFIHTLNKSEKLIKTKQAYIIVFMDKVFIWPLNRRILLYMSKRSLVVIQVTASSIRQLKYGINDHILNYKTLSRFPEEKHKLLFDSFTALQLFFVVNVLYCKSECCFTLSSYSLTTHWWINAPVLLWSNWLIKNSSCLLKLIKD